MQKWRKIALMQISNARALKKQRELVFEQGVTGDLFSTTKTQPEQPTWP